MEDVIAFYNYPIGAYREDGTRLHSNRMRDNRRKLECQKFQLDKMKKNCYEGSQMLEQVAQTDCTSLEMSKTVLDTVPGNLM